MVLTVNATYDRPSSASLTDITSILNTSSCPKTPASARRRLLFMENIFQGETFYLDLKGYVHFDQLEESIVRLGARVERFLSREITCVVTSNKTVIKPSRSNSPPSDPNSPNSCSGQSTRTSFPSALSRGQALLNRANLNTRNTSKKEASDVIAFAHKWNIKIRHVREITRAIQREFEKCNTSASWLDSTKPNPGQSQACGQQKIKQLNGAFIKVEDMSGFYRPLSSNFDTFPGIESLIHEKVVEVSHVTQPMMQKAKHQSKAKVKPRDKVAVKTAGNQKKKLAGYCECCDVYYKDVHQHVTTKSHRNFVQCKENFAILDDTISKLPTLSDLLGNLGSGAPGDTNDGSSNQTFTEQERLDTNISEGNLSSSARGLTTPEDQSKTKVPSSPSLTRKSHMPKSDDKDGQGSYGNKTKLADSCQKNSPAREVGSSVPKKKKVPTATLR